MSQRWKREKLAGDQNCPASEFPFVFQEPSDDDFCQTDYVPSNPSGQLVEECEKNNISKILHLSLAEFSIVSYLFFFELVAFVVLKAHFPLITFMYFILFFM
jgi:hypothetical protein